MQSITLHLDLMLRSLADDVDLDPNTVSYCLKRLRAEGIKFLTVTLPALSKSVLHSLEKGYFVRPTCIAWKGRSLRYFRSLLDGIFNPDGTVRRVVDVYCLNSLRQFCEYLYKLALAYDREQLAAYEKKYLSLETELSTLDLDPKYIDRLRCFIETNYDLHSVSLSTMLESKRPRFGPGSFVTANPTPFYVQRDQHDNLVGTCREDQRAFSGYFKPYPSSPTKITLVDEGKTSHVLFVPKDSRGPRVISKEPPHLLRMQLSFLDYFVSHLEHVTNKNICFTDQLKQRQLAYEGSLYGTWATLDLKDASDRVSYSLVKKLFCRIPVLNYMVTRCRSTHTKLPSGDVIRLKKLSGMGSGLTFPIMALIIHASISLALKTKYGLDPASAMSYVHVYGDDICVPPWAFSDAVRALNSCGLAVNTDKSFIHSKFRESCGGDYYNGNFITPVRLRLPAAELGDASSCSSRLILSTFHGHYQLERHCRELKESGMISLAEYYYKKLETVYGKLPVCTNKSFSGFARWTNVHSIPDDGFIRTYVAVPCSVYTRTQSPYKLLSRAYKRSYDSLGLSFDSSELRQYDVTIPRRVRGVMKTFYSHELRE